MKALRQWYERLSWEKKLFAMATVISLVPILAALLAKDKSAERISPDLSRKRGASQFVDTYIPKGFVLVPIDIQNYESLDSILGQYGIVDLFAAGRSESARHNLVARNVRILRAPQNPSHFAVLVQEAQVAQILKFGNTFTVTVKRPDKNGMEIVTTTKTPRRSIVYEGE